MVLRYSMRRLVARTTGLVGAMEADCHLCFAFICLGNIDVTLIAGGRWRGRAGSGAPSGKCAWEGGGGDGYAGATALRIWRRRESRAQVAGGGRCVCVCVCVLRRAVRVRVRRACATCDVRRAACMDVVRGDAAGGRGPSANIACTRRQTMARARRVCARAHVRRGTRSYEQAVCARRAAALACMHGRMTGRGLYVCACCDGGLRGGRRGGDEAGGETRRRDSGPARRAAPRDRRPRSRPAGEKIRWKGGRTG